MSEHTTTKRETETTAPTLAAATAPSTAGELKEKELEAVAGGDIGGNLIDAAIEQYKDIKKGIMCTLREFDIV